MYVHTRKRVEAAFLSPLPFLDIEASCGCVRTTHAQCGRNRKCGGNVCFSLVDDKFMALTIFLLVRASVDCLIFTTCSGVGYCAQSGAEKSVNALLLHPALFVLLPPPSSSNIYWREQTHWQGEGSDHGRVRGRHGGERGGREGLRAQGDLRQAPHHPPHTGAKLAYLHVWVLSKRARIQCSVRQVVMEPAPRASRSMA